MEPHNPRFFLYRFCVRDMSNNKTAIFESGLHWFSWNVLTMSKGPATTHSLGTSPQQTNRMLIGRMLALAWKYRWGCVSLLAVNVILLAMGILGLSLMGVGVDFIRYELVADEAQHLVMAGSTPRADSAISVAPKPPQWPLGIKPPAHWTRYQVLLAIAFGIVVLAVARALLNFSNVILANRLTQAQIVVDLRARVFAKMQELSFRFFDSNTSGSLINRVTGDVQAVRQFIDGVVIQVITLAISLAIFLTYMLHIHPGLTAACLASTPLLWFLSAKFSNAVKPSYKKNRDLFDKLILALSENVQGAHVIKGFARQKEQIAQFDAMNAQFRDQQFAIFSKISTFHPMIAMLTNINIMIMLAYGGYLVVQHELATDPSVTIGLSIGQLIVFAGLLQQFSGQVGSVANVTNTVQQCLIGAQRVFEVLDTPTEILTAPDSVRLTECKGRVGFDHVGFAYNHDAPVLSDLTFTVEPGQCAAILGPTGSGKSSLLSLIPRFYDTTAGTLTLDNIDIRKIDLHDLRRSIGIVFQESFLFSNTIAANIAFGQPDATRKQIQLAAEIACAHNFIMEMPKGYDTILHEGGINLSGGQRQRLAIARAIILEPAILILDDPTASIDPETEKDIMTAIENAMKGRTTFIVSNRLSTSRRADTVIVLHGGRVVQTGTHDELISTDGYYQSAASMQIPDEESLRLLGMPVEAL